MDTTTQWPKPVVDLLQSASLAQYASVSSAGVPIDTPVLFFPSEGLVTFDLATGVSYPAKAERARRNARTSLLVEGRPDEPVVLILGFAAVRDRDLQSNAIRYLAEAGQRLPHDPPWELARQAVWYWTRILVEIKPSRVLWWDSPLEMHRAPHCWHAPAGTSYPVSDPPPGGSPSKPANWEKQSSWRQLAKRALTRGAPGHLSWLDEQGFPLSIRATSIDLSADGFSMNVPHGIPTAPSGKASLTFNGIETFVGEMLEPHVLRVERALPILPMTADMAQLWRPTLHTQGELMKRLIAETERRGQRIPMIPLERPEPSAGYKLRMARLRSEAKHLPE